MFYVVDTTFIIGVKANPKNSKFKFTLTLT